MNDIAYIIATIMRWGSILLLGIVFVWLIWNIIKNEKQRPQSFLVLVLFVVLALMFGRDLLIPDTLFPSQRSESASGASNWTWILPLVAMIGLFIIVVISALRRTVRYSGQTEKRYTLIGYSLILFLIFLTLSLILVPLVFAWECNASLIVVSGCVCVVAMFAVVGFQMWQQGSFKRGQQYLRYGEYNDALRSFEKGLERIPDSASGHHGRALAFVGLGEYEQAIVEYDQAISFAPKATNYYQARGLIHAALGSYSQALEDLDRVIELEPRRKKNISLMQDIVHRVQRQEPGAKDELMGILERMSHYW